VALERCAAVGERETASVCQPQAAQRSITRCAATNSSHDSARGTVAVLGCGIDRDYPAAHADLARRIAETGGIVSEYEPGTEPAPWRFPARNRRRSRKPALWLNHAESLVASVS
jgi:DNA processing protein